MQSVYYNSLGANKQYYDGALRCFQNQARGFPVPSSAVADDLFGHVVNEHPELFYVSQQLRVASSLFRQEAMPTYLYSSAEVSQLRTKLEQTAQALIRELINDHQSDYDKVRVLHDYLKSHIEYDYAAASSMRVTERNVAEAHNIVGSLLNHKCVCDGFAKAMKYLCDKIGLECWVISGKGSGPLASGPHAWNIVRINGYYHHVDVTWDNQYADSAEIPNYGYLNLSDEEISKDHSWNRKHYPACPDSPYNYFRVNNSLLDSRAQLESLLYNSFQMEEEFILFRVVRGSLLEREINGCIQECIQRASNRCRHISVTSFQYNFIPEQLTFQIRPQYSYR